MIVVYNDAYREAWDELVMNASYNGNFLQTRRFLDYHEKNKFIDHSLMFFKGETLAAVMPANVSKSGNRLISHAGSTFGGLVIRDIFCSTMNYKWIFSDLINHFEEQGYESMELKMPHWLYRRLDESNELLDYFFQLNGFVCRSEVGFFVDLSRLSENFETQFDSLRRRKLKKSYQQNLLFRELKSDEEIKRFYGVLEDNMCKFDTVPVHTFDELLDLKRNRLSDIVSFYGVYHENDLIAGSMVFSFGDRKVFHTQYLASRHDCLEYCPNEYMYTNLMRRAKDLEYRFLSFGTSTLEHGNVYNESLGLFKEGFHTDTYLNRTYILKREIER